MSELIGLFNAVLNVVRAWSPTICAILLYLIYNELKQTKYKIVVTEKKKSKKPIKETEENKESEEAPKE